MKKTTVTIYRDVQPHNLRRLAAMVCLRALDELKGEDPLIALDALLWITSGDFEMWAEVAGVPFADPFIVLTRGNSYRTRKKGRQPHESKRGKCVGIGQGDDPDAGKGISGSCYSRIEGITAGDRQQARA